MLYSFITVSAPTLLKFGMCVEIKCVEKCSLVSINKGIYLREEEGINIVYEVKNENNGMCFGVLKVQQFL